MGEADELKGAVNEGWNFAWRCRGRFAIVQIASNQAAILQLDAPDSTKVLTVVSAINGVNMWKQNYLIWKLHDAEIFELNSHGITRNHMPDYHAIHELFDRRPRKS